MHTPRPTFSLRKALRGQTSEEVPGAFTNFMSVTLNMSQTGVLLKMQTNQNGAYLRQNVLIF